jgi:ADP-ribose pyrophosphatase
MGRNTRAVSALLSDRPAVVALSPPQVLAKAFRDYERYHLTRERADGERVSEERDLVRGGRVAAVLPIDLQRREVVLIRQFRLAAHLANGNGELVEIVAGRIATGEASCDAARRECFEEIGVRPSRLVELFTFLPSPGVTDEEVVLFIAAVDASAVPERAGAANEHEDIRPFCVGIDAAIAALERGTMRFGPLILALQWLALNRARLDAVLDAENARS